MAKLIYLDTETTGLDCNRNGIIQIAGIIEIDGEVKEEFNLRCKPFEQDIITQEALDITGVTVEEVKSYDSPLLAYHTLKNIFSRYIDKFDKDDKFIPVGQNVLFDLRFLKSFFEKSGDKFFGSYVVWYHYIDLMPCSMAMKVAGHIDISDLKLGTVAEALGFKFEAHDALEDIRTTRKVWLHFLNLLKKDGEQLDFTSPILCGAKPNSSVFLEGQEDDKGERKVLRG